MVCLTSPWVMSFRVLMMTGRITIISRWPRAPRPSRETEERNRNLTFMLYLNDRGAHVGDEASHGAVRQAPRGLPREKEWRNACARGKRGTSTTGSIFLLGESWEKAEQNSHNGFGNCLVEAGIELVQWERWNL
jgi:hypothetical protein